MRGRAAARRSERRLAEDRAGASGRQFARERLDAWVRERPWRLLRVLGLTLLAAAVLATVLVGHPLLQGLAVGSFLAATLTALYHWALMASGAAYAELGEAGEQMTSTELARLRRSGWRFVNHLQFRVGDIDHVAVGPDGVVVIETKWTSMPVDLDRPSDWLRQASAQVRRNERDVAGFLGWGARKDARITSLLVVWGPQVTQSGDEAVLTDDGVNIVAGRHLRTVLGDLGERILSDDEIDAVYRKLAAWVEKKDRWNADASAEAPLTLVDRAERVQRRITVASVVVLAVAVAAAAGLRFLGR